MMTTMKMKIMTFQDRFDIVADADMGPIKRKKKLYPPKTVPALCAFPMKNALD